MIGILRNIFAISATIDELITNINYIVAQLRHWFIQTEQDERRN